MSYWKQNASAIRSVWKRYSAILQNKPGLNFMFTSHDTFSVFDLFTLIFILFICLFNVTYFFSQSQFIWEKVENGRGWQSPCQGDVSAGFTVEEDKLSWSSSTELAEVWFAGSFGRTVEKKKSKTKQLALTRRSWTKTCEYVAALLSSISGRPLVCHTGLDAGLFLANFSFSLKEFFCLFSVFSLKAS